MLKTLLGILSVSLLLSCALDPEKPVSPNLLLADHVLVGKIWDVKAQAFVTQDQLKQAVLNSSYILLGETHDNLAHHQGQAWVINQLAESERKAAVAFEMISQQQEAIIANRQFDSAEALIAGLNHIKTNWEYERFYKPLLARSLSAGFGIYAANMDRQEIMSIARQGEEKIPPDIKKIVDVVELSADQIAASRKEIEGSHCGMINEQMTSAMMLVQRVKDAVMADALTQRQNVDARVLVAGSGHVRNDRGVPYYLQQFAHENKILSIAWAEVHPEATNATAYAAHWGAPQLPFDYVWFTARVDRPDPCEGFRQHMKAKKS